MVFFMNADGKIYARYGGRDAQSPDSRQSLDGLRYTMESVLRFHDDGDHLFAPKSQEAPRFIREVARPRRAGKCMHCHQVKEALNADLQKTGKWRRDMLWRYPLPENLGFDLEIDRGNVIRAVKAGSPASKVGLAVADVLERVRGVPIHSFADVQFALDTAPTAGAIEVSWRRGGEVSKGLMTLPEGWRKSDISWRPSLRNWIPSARLYGHDLSAEEKESLGLPSAHLAFRQKDLVPAQAEAAGIRGGDIILGVDGKRLESDVDGFLRYVQRNYLVGDFVTVNVLREGKRMDFPMKLLR
jgi:S1-C subfamily serine protease